MTISIDTVIASKMQFAGIPYARGIPWQNTARGHKKIFGMIEVLPKIIL
jgi:hypothetical protein